MKVCPYIYFRCCWYFRGPWGHLLRQMSSQWGSQQLLQGLVFHELTVYLSDFDLFLSQWNGHIIERRKRDNFESHGSLKLYFTNILGLRSSFVECESFIESNSPGILALCETNVDDSVGICNFSVKSLCFWLALLHSVSYFLFLNWSPCTVFDAILYNIDVSVACISQASEETIQQTFVWLSW